jgi:cellulose synthase/poly-beta-1,6-N-acetylglucosamine synthase-like glycosyltransferase
MAKRQVADARAATKVRLPGSNGNGREKGPVVLDVAEATALREETPELTSRLNIVKDTDDFSYKVPGLLAWLAVGLAIFGAVFLPRVLVIVSQIAAVYMLIRIMVVVVFYPVGIRKIKQAEARARAARGKRPKGAERLHHVVLMPNYHEPVQVLSRTLRCLAGQADARRRLTIVLAMEGAEAGAYAKAQQLHTAFEGYFARIIITIHPADLPGESPGKSSNQAWASRQAKHELVDRLGIPLDNLTLTSCDSDTVFHADYFAEIDRLWAADPERYRRFWHAPMRLANNLWSVPSPVRLLTYFFNLIQVSELADPLAVKLPVSSFTLSYKLAHEVGYWDAFALADDWNVFLRCVFGTRGKIKLVPLFLPTFGDAVTGTNTREALANFYKQRLRHAWGCQDVGYVLQQWSRWPDMPRGPKLVYLGKVVHDHVVFTTAGLVIAVGTVVLVLQQGPIGAIRPLSGLYATLYPVANALNLVGLSLGALYEHLSSRRVASGWRPAKLAIDIVLWPLVFVLMVFLVALPTILAQTKMMFGARLTFEVTPKQVD